MQRLNSLLGGLTNRPRLWSLVCGAFLALGQAPFDIPWTVFVAAPALFLILRDQTLISTFWVGWFAGLGYFLATLHWIVEPFLVDLPHTGWMAPFALIFMTGGLALFWGLAYWLAGRFRHRPHLLVVALPIFWTGGEILRSVVLTGFPWALPAYIWVDTPIAMSLAWIGPYGLSYLTLQLAILPAAVTSILIAVPLVAVAIVGAWLGLANLIPAGFNLSGTSVRLVQPNAQQHEKWDPNKIRTFWLRQLDATAAPGDVDIVIWPEVAVPYLFDKEPRYNAEIARQKPGAAVLFGARHVDEAAGRWFNSAVLLNRDGDVQAYYDKSHLVPFGEYLPFPEVWDRFGLQALAQNAGRFASGSGQLVGAIDSVPAFAPLICYEVIFPDQVRQAAEHSRWIVHLTNDAWFGNFSGPFQHFAQAKARAIETGLPVARAANTGISAMIDPYGRVVASLDLNTHGHLDTALPQPVSRPFQQVPHWQRAIGVMVAGALLLPILPIWRRRG